MNAPKEIISILKRGGIGVLPTDTIYGLVGAALNKKTVRRIYKAKKRNPSKPFIVLISSMKDLELFDIKIDKVTKRILKKLWPGQISIILSSLNKKYYYLHRGTKTLAFRLPVSKSLINLLKEVGPLVAPSANVEGKLPAKTIKEAKVYFGNKIYPELDRRVDFYVDKGRIMGKPSTLISVLNGKVVVLREGCVRLKL
ncbi:MAG: L-threonylcarbamoyladenylate synthase [bacterium]|nr:L-threonylcarbamoyladenylate synthase [bacterium]